MLDLREIEKEPEILIKSLKKRCFKEADETVSKLLDLNTSRKDLIQKADQLRAERKQISKEFGKLKKNNEDVSELSAKSEALKSELEKIEENLNNIQADVDQILYSIPNILAEEVPEGKDDTQNVEIYKWGEPKKFEFKPLAHWELGEKSGLIDLKRGAKLAGSRFYVLWKEAAKLERALINFFLDEASKDGYEEIWPPYMANTATLTGTGQLPKFEEDLFKIADTDYYLIPTAEVPVTNLYASETVKESDLPIKHAAFTACFRKEAGSYGKDTKGIVRVHQFSKVELVKISAPEQSEKEHELLLKNATNLLELLNLPYRVVLLCGGDTGFSARKCYDIEVWIPSENKYREISSVSNFGDFQARRAGIKVKGDKSKCFAHTLNGSGLAVGRAMVAIFENYQNEDGTITIPEVLREYMRGIEKIGGRI